MTTIQSILYITQYASMYGANRSLLGLLAEREKRGLYSFVVVPTEGELTSVLRNIGVPYKVVPFNLMFHVPSNRANRLLVFARWTINKLRSVRNSIMNRIAARSIAQIARINEVEIIHSNSVLTPVGLFAAKLLKIPHVWHIREFCDLDYHLEPNWGQKAKRKLLEQSEHIICISEAIKNHHCKDMDSVSVIHNGVMNGETAESLEFTASGKFTCLIMGYLSETKGQHVAIEAISILDARGVEVELLVVGDGDHHYLNRLKTMVEEAQIGDLVTFVGKVDDPLSYFQKCELTLMCSQNEGMGRVTPEAMLCGSVVIGFDNAGTSELIEHGKTGLLYQSGPAELADHIFSLYDDTKKLNYLRGNALMKSRERFLTDRYEQAVNRCYAAL